MRIKDQVAIVTGAGSGIGKETAIRFGREGAKVLCFDIKGQEETASQSNDPASGDGICF
ncbi:SDR family NAD(P)-dependent oxidoreductase [Schinkia sp. CFF1]